VVAPAPLGTVQSATTSLQNSSFAKARAGRSRPEQSSAAKGRKAQPVNFSAGMQGERTDMARSRLSGGLVVFQQSGTQIAPCCSSRRDSLRETLLFGLFRSGGVPPLLRLQPRQGSIVAGPQESVGRHRSSAKRRSAAAVLPNPSVKPSANGGPPGPGLWHMVHHHSPGPGVPPSSPAYLER
jgi:hypothetical protein